VPSNSREPRPCPNFPPQRPLFSIGLFLTHLGTKLAGPPNIIRHSLSGVAKFPPFSSLCFFISSLFCRLHSPFKTCGVLYQVCRSALFQIGYALGVLLFFFIRCPAVLSELMAMLPLNNPVSMKFSGLATLPFPLSARFFFSSEEPFRLEASSP